MLKNNEIIQSLNLRQKLSLLAGGDCGVSGVPRVAAADIDTLSEEIPSVLSIANSFNTDLTYKLSATLAYEAKAKDFNAVITPNLCACPHIYRKAISEDSFVTKAACTAFSKGISAASALPILNGCYVNQSDADFMDSYPDKNIIRDYVVMPFKSAVKSGGLSGGTVVLTSDLPLKKHYRDVNIETMGGLIADNRSGEVKRITDSDMTPTGLMYGQIMSLSTSLGKLEEGYNNFLNYKKHYENGRISPADFTVAINSGQLLDDNAVDVAADKVLQLASMLSENDGSFNSENDEGISSKTANDNDTTGRITIDKAAIGELSALALLATEESTVLLKNDGCLPLKPSTKLAVIGNIINSGNIAGTFSTIFADPKTPVEYTGFAEGYSFDDTILPSKQGELIADAVQLAQKSDTVVVCLGFGSDFDITKQRVTLPAAQTALLDALSKTGKKIVAVMVSDYSFNPSFDSLCHALLFMPSGKYAHIALANIVSGKINPSGRLATTIYSNPDEHFAMLKKQKSLGIAKVGGFFGYRYYDTADYAKGKSDGLKIAKYPFGYGLSYTSFSYSALKVSEDGVRFTVKNTGTRAGGEVCQLYVSKTQSNVLRPSKQLVGFEKIFLEPNQSREVFITFDYDDFKVHDSSDGELKVEDGEYGIFVAASVSDIKLRGKHSVSGHKIVGKKESMTTYFGGQTNIVKDGFSVGQPEQKKLKNIKLAAIIMLVLTGIYDIMVGILAYSSPYIIAFLLPNLLILIWVLMLVYVTNARKALLIAAELESENITEISTEPTLEKMFLDEFYDGKDDDADESDDRYKPYTGITFGVNTTMPLMGDGFPFSTVPFNQAEQLSESINLDEALSRLNAAMAHKGIAASAKSTAALIAAISSAKNLVLKGDDSLLPSLADCLCEVFGFVSKPESTPIFQVINTTEFEPNNISNINAFGGEASALAIDKAATPTPDTNFNEDKAVRLNINLPDSFYRQPSITLEVKLRKITPSADSSNPLNINRLQFINLINRLNKESILSEPAFKRLDKLMDTLGFTFDNKQWHAVEAFTSLCLSCGDTEPEALDSVVAAIALPLISADIIEGKDLPYTLEKILGEGSADESISTLKHFR